MRDRHVHSGPGRPGAGDRSVTRRRPLGSGELYERASLAADTVCRSHMYWLEASLTHQEIDIVRRPLRSTRHEAT